MQNMNILDTQQQILHLLIQTETALHDLVTSYHTANERIDDANGMMSITENNQDAKDTIEYEALTRSTNILANERQKVANMEMVIAVVGTLKAGKSTIINAMVGQELLPNSELATTAFPTLITHKKGQTTPVLTFKQTQPLIELREKIVTQLNTADATDDIDDIATSITKPITFIDSPASQRLLDQLNNPKAFALQTHYEGQTAILNILQYLNDLIRMAQALDIVTPYAEYQKINQLPRIEVEFFHLKHNKHFQQTRLSFLDTPGSNELANNEALNTIFQQQLEQSSAILLAIDYTQMSSQAGDTMRQEIQQIQANLGQKMIVFVNKFDNSSKNTMNSALTKSYVSQQLMGNNLPEKHIFPISSWWGYLANKAIMTLEANKNLDTNAAWVKDFGEAALGRNWHKKITDRHEVEEASQALWQDSQFSTPINEVITTIHTQSATKCFGTSLDKLDTLLRHLNTDIKHHLVVLKKNITDSEISINQLNQEKASLKSIKTIINAKRDALVHEINKKMVNKSNQYIRKAIKITNVFIETGYKENQLIAEINQKEKPSSIYDEIRDSKSNKIIYKNKNNAIYLLNDMQCYINSIKRNLLEKSDNMLQINIKEIEKKINIIFDSEFKTSFIKAIKNNNFTTYGSFILPKFICKKHIESLQIKNLISVGIKEKTSTRHRAYVNNKVLNSFNENWGKRIHEKETQKFEIKINKIKKHIAKDMNKYTNSIENNHKKYLEDNILNKIKKDTDEIKLYINDQQSELSSTLEKIIQKAKKNQQMIKALEKASHHIAPLLDDTKYQLDTLKQRKISTKTTILSTSKKDATVLAIS